MSQGQGQGRESNLDAIEIPVIASVNDYRAAKKLLVMALLGQEFAPDAEVRAGLQEIEAALRLGMEASGFVEDGKGGVKER